MKTHVNLEFVHQICEEVASVLESFLLDEPEKFPYTMACIHFMEELANKGKSVEFDQFDSEIIDGVFKELGESLRN